MDPVARSDPWPYFAYGSNLGVSQLHRRCPRARQVGVAELRGHRIGFTRISRSRGGGVADLVPEAGASVWGALFDLQDDGFGALDEYEGVPTAYRREVWEFTKLDRSTVRAWVYVVAAKRPDVLPSYQYWKVIVEGAREAGLPAEYVGLLEALPHGPP